MNINLQLARDEEQWGELLTRAPHRTIFHTWKWLKIVEKNTKTKLYPFIGFKGTTPVGIIPLFYQKKGLLKLFFSPPSGAGLLYLGPLIIDYENMKQCKRESTFFEFQKAVDNYIFSKIKGNYARIRSSPGLMDLRPFRWTGYEVEPYYTYMIDLRKGRNFIWEGLKKELRKNIAQAEKMGINIEEGSKNELSDIHTSLTQRFEEQGLESNLSIDYLKDIYNAFYPINLKIFIIKYNGEFIGGQIAICDQDKVSLWVGSMKTPFRGIPTDLLHWKIIEWGLQNGFKFFEIMDAGDNPRLSAYKSKFNPDLLIWFSATKYSSVVLKAAKELLGIIRARKV
jgi:hypothetical protein